jgi:hypothetical protein
MIMLVLMYVWFCLGGLLSAYQRGIRNRRELLAESLLFLPMMFLGAMKAFVENSYALIAYGFKGWKVYQDYKNEESAKKLVEEIFGKTNG